MQQNQLTGINVELVKLLCQRAKITCNISLLPWRRAFDMAQHNVYSGVFSTSRNAEREALFSWVGPIASEPGYLFRLKGRTEVNPANLDEAKNYILAVSRGDRLESYFQSKGFRYGSNMMGFSTRTEPIPLFFAHKVDLLSGSKRSLRSWMLEHNMPADTAEPLFLLADIGAHYLALNPQFPADVALALQRELDIIHQNGELTAILQRYP
ncbi:hypothetical protein WG68_13495 [Arsukibacterium ikkense]|uniref:Solute-binding protein family 3/N-terminal domain-containing protein n=2 Tax=Arsukibacterium ikkense TaxID=336831 RepID=A0A0M2V5J0_9GAMM|nr:hypothetical protein WG68_13495 [Arsukibacterium ikkense]